MSYLLENSLIVSKKEYNENEEEYISHEKYEIDDYYIVTQNDKPFFSIYDIASYCKKKYKDSKLFLIVHRYFDKIKEDTVTEFYIFNTVDIFEKSLTSFLTMSLDELSAKQHILQNNIKIAQKLLNCFDLHIILGDNTKEHEIKEYVLQKPHDIDIVLFNKEKSLIQNIEKNINQKIKNYDIVSTRISTVLSSIRVIESKNQKIKKLFILFIIIFATLFGSGDFTDSLFEQKIIDTKKSINFLKKKLSRLEQDVNFKIKQNNSLVKNIKLLNTKKIFESKK